MGSVWYCCGVILNPDIPGGLIKEFKRYMYVYPLSKTVWYPFVQTSSYKLIHQVRVFFFHTLFSYFVDCMLFMARKRPMWV